MLVQFIASKLQMNIIKHATVILHVEDISSFELLSHPSAVPSLRVHKLMRCEQSFHHFAYYTIKEIYMVINI